MTVLRTHIVDMPETRGRALIVEDDQDLRLVLSILLTTEGWNVAAAASLDEAVAELNEVPDVLVLEITPGNVAGQEASDLLARLACRADAPVTVLVSDDDDVQPLARHYGVAYARKPIELDALMQTLDVALSQARRPSVGHLRATWTSVRPSAPALA